MRNTDCFLPLNDLPDLGDIDAERRLSKLEDQKLHFVGAGLK